MLLLKPRGFCAGVVRAIDIVRIALEAFGPPIYVRKEIVHNRFVVEELHGKGAIFVDSDDEVPNGERIIYSAHGVSPDVREHSAERGLRVIDATCPLVTKVHVEAVKFAKEGYSLILIGHHDHDEVIGTLGEAPLVTQVVGSPEQVESLTVPDPEPRGLSDANDVEPGRNQRHHRGAAAEVPQHQRAGSAGYLLCHREPPGRREAGGFRRRFAAGGGFGKQFELQPPGGSGAQPGHERPSDRQLQRHQPEWLEGVKTIALTAGASAPECLVEETVTFLRNKGFDNVQEVEVMPENVRFGLPPEIVEAIAAAPASGVSCRLGVM